MADEALVFVHSPLVGPLTWRGVADRFTAELRPLPVDYFDEPMPPARWSGPAGYLLLSEVYRDDATRAAGLGMPVVERISDHLAMVTAPDDVTAALRELLAALDTAPAGSFEALA